MMFIKLPLIDRFTYINADKILFFEENRVGFTELHLDSGETLTIPVSPEELLSFLAENPIDNDTIMLNQADIEKQFR